MHFLQIINSDISVLIVCNKTGGTIKGDIKKIHAETMDSRRIIITIPDISYFLNSALPSKVYATWPVPIQNRSTTGTSS